MARPVSIIKCSCQRIRGAHPHHTTCERTRSSRSVRSLGRPTLTISSGVMRTCIYLKTHACISKKREPQTKKTAGVLNVQSKHDRKTIEHGEGPGLGRRAVLQGSTVLLVFEASRGNASEFSNQGGMETLEDEDYNYLENEPAENMVATEAFSSLSAASVFLNTIVGRGSVAAVGTCMAETLTLPLDTIKVREQLARQDKGVQRVGTLESIIASEGVGALWNGLVPGLQHHFLSGGVKIGLYEPVKASIETVLGSTASPFLLSGAAGMLCGVAGTFGANPTDVVKVRMQNNSKDETDSEKLNVLEEYRAVLNQHGILGFWNGFAPNAARSATISGLQFMGYDYLRSNILFHYPDLGIPVAALIAGTIAGCVCGVVINPVDVVKINTMARQEGSSSFAVAKQMIEQEGILSLCKGLGPSVLRVGSFDGLMFYFNECLRSLILQIPLH